MGSIGVAGMVPTGHSGAQGTPSHGAPCLYHPLGVVMAKSPLIFKGRWQDVCGWVGGGGGFFSQGAMGEVRQGLYHPSSTSPSGECLGGCVEPTALFCHTQSFAGILSAGSPRAVRLGLNCSVAVGSGSL